MSGDEWHYPGSGRDAKSFTLRGTVISPFSNHCQSALPPSHESSNPINGHRFVAFVKYGIDMTDDGGGRLLSKALADDGYGTFDDKPYKVRRAEKIEKVKRGQLSPLAIRRTPPNRRGRLIGKGEPLQTATLDATQ